MSKSIKSKEPASVIFTDITKIYGTNVVAVDKVSFTIEPGQLVTLLGPSGCGKTTILRMIAGLEFSNSGTITIGDTDVTRLPATDRDVSMVFQSYALFPHMNIIDNISFGLRFSKISKAEILEQAMAGLNTVGLKGLEKRLPSELSGGQQQRVAVARAIVLKPQVLLFDEPLSNLDAKLRRSVREDIRDLQKSLGLTVAYVTHDQEEALAVSDKIIVMDKAKIVQKGTPRDLYERPVNTFIADFIGEANLIDCELKSAGDGLARIVIGDKELEIKQGAYSLGKPKVAVRPSHIHLNNTSDGHAFPATVKKASYLGIGMEYTLETDFGSLFVTTTDVVTPHSIGEQVSVSLDTSKTVLVECA